MTIHDLQRCPLRWWRWLWTPRPAGPVQRRIVVRLRHGATVEWVTELANVQATMASLVEAMQHRGAVFAVKPDNVQIVTLVRAEEIASAHVTWADIGP